MKLLLNCLVMLIFVIPLSFYAQEESDYFNNVDKWNRGLEEMKKDSRYKPLLILKNLPPNSKYKAFSIDDCYKCLKSFKYNNYKVTYFKQYRNNNMQVITGSYLSKDKKTVNSIYLKIKFYRDYQQSSKSIEREFGLLNAKKKKKTVKGYIKGDYSWNAGEIVGPAANYILYSNMIIFINATKSSRLTKEEKSKEYDNFCEMIRKEKVENKNVPREVTICVRGKEEYINMEKFRDEEADDLLEDFTDELLKHIQKCQKSADKK